MSNSSIEWQTYICRACGLIYDEKEGDPDSGLAPGTRFEDIPEGWECPLCGVKKSDFELFERPDIVSSLTSVNAASRNMGGSNRAEKGIVIIGAGTSGWSMVKAIRELDGSIPITLVSACPANVYHKPELSIALSRGFDEEKLVKETGAEASSKWNVSLIPLTYVVGVSPCLKQIRTTRGTVNYSKLVIAQGAKARLPEPLDPQSVWRVNDLQSWGGLSEKLSIKPKQRVLIIGAGMVGCELAEDFTRAGHEVILLNRDHTPLHPLLPEQAGQKLIQSFEKLGVSHKANAQLKQMEPTSKGNYKVTLESNEELIVDHLISATGLHTDQRLARLAKLDFDNGIAVDSKSLQTSDANIYALGDCISIQGSACRFIEPINKQAQVIARQVVPKQATDDEKLEYEHKPPVIRLKTKSCPVVLHGMPASDGEWRVLSETQDELTMEQRLDETVIASLHLKTA